MLQSITLYIFIGLIAVIVILGGCWWYQSSRDAATIDTLKANNIRLEDAVSLNERTIQQMVADAQTLAAANTKLTSRIAASEIENATTWQTIEALDLQSTGDDSGLEAKANERFSASIDAIRAATNR